VKSYLVDKAALFKQVIPNSVSYLQFTFSTQALITYTRIVLHLPDQKRKKVKPNHKGVHALFTAQRAASDAHVNAASVQIPENDY
jgi:hypothetical protein